MQPLDTNEPQNIGQDLPHCIDELLAQMRAEVPLVSDFSDEYGQVAERSRLQLIESLTRLELAAHFLRVVVTNNPRDWDLYDSIFQAANRLQMDAAGHTFSFRERCGMKGEG